MLSWGSQLVNIPREHKLTSITWIRTTVWGYVDSSYTPHIVKASKDIQQAIVDGTNGGGRSGKGKKEEPLRAYVNYSFGDETESEMYGADKLPKLQTLKNKYDPRGKVSFYAPITPKRK